MCVVDDAPKESGAEGTQATVFAWSPAPRHKRRWGLWIGTPVAVALVGVVTASLILIAPGTAVAGVQVGGMTAGAAASAIQQQLEKTSVTLTGDGVDATLTATQLGAKVDAQALADAAYGDHPMWKVGSWFSDTRHAPLALDAAKADAALRKAAPSLFRDAKDATVAFDATKKAYVTTDAADGAGVDLTAVTEALQDAFTSGRTNVTLSTTSVPTAPAISTATAQKTAKSLNTMLGKIGFYVGSERTVPVAPQVAASWLTVTPQGDGFAISADQAAIAKVVATLPKKIDRAAQNGTAITDTQGKVLRTEVATLDGRTLGDTSGLAASFAKQLADGNGVATLPVSVAKATTTKVSRSAVVDLSEQRAYFYQNGTLYKSYLVSTGAAGHATPTGHFRVFAHVPMQDMGCVDGYTYCTKNVPWVTYFAPNIGFHGTYWHHNFGHVMSHGCVNLPIDQAHLVYDWAPEGMEVTVQP
ncbi:L,D-transpeptidase [Microbacterium sp.]|uniref:L,D-transpeptidase n=1 Tax=Microbacterium sp. TaxID=51671 RepID=UPI003A90D2FC